MVINGVNVYSGLEVGRHVIIQIMYHLGLVFWRLSFGMVANVSDCAILVWCLGISFLVSSMLCL